MKKWIVSSLFVLLLLAPTVSGQEITGSVSGVVTDQTGGAIPNAKVELINEGTSVALVQTTNQEGVFTFNLVTPGTYSVRCGAQGFRTGIKKGISVEVSRTSRADLNLQVGQVSESVEVTASASVIDTASAQVSTNVEKKFLTDLPSGSRNVLTFASLAPGVSISNTDSQVLNIEGTYANVNGNRRGQNVYYLDGSDNTGSFRNSALQMPNPDAVQEVSVTTSSTSAEFGKQPGGTFNVITKSGTNEFHGSGFYFWRMTDLNANSFDRNRTGSPRPEAKLKQGGGTLGGPVVKNRTFFFSSFQIYRDNSAGFQNTIRFPTQQMMQGNFSQFASPVYDPDSPGTPFAGNIIPASKLDPVARNLGSLIPTVGNYGDRYIWAFTQPVSSHEVLGKVDHTVNDKHNLSFSYFRSWGDQILPATAATGNVPAFGPQVNASNQNTGSVRHNWIASSNIIVQSRFAIARHSADRGNANLGKNLADFGARWPDSQEGARKYLPQFVISDGPAARQGWLSLFEQSNFRFGSTLSWLKGRHNIKAGFEMQRDTVLQRNDQDSTTFNFDGRFASLAAPGKPAGVGVFGYSFADYVMGRSASFSTSGILDYNLYNWSDFFFVQDDWKITSRLTLSPGLRYEIYTPATESNNRASAFILGHKSLTYANAPVNMAFLQDPNIPAGFFAQDRNNIAPRLGFAYDVTSKGTTVIRGGAGYFYAYNSTQIKMWNAEAPPWRPSASGGVASSLRDPWGSSTQPVYSAPPTPFTSDVSNFKYPNPINNMVGFDTNFRTPYTVQWNVGVLREIANGVTVETSYVANRGYKLLQTLPGNLPLWRTDANLNNILDRRPVKGYGNVSIIHSRARSWYDSLQIVADVRRVKGLTGRFSYVFADEEDLVNNDPTSNSQIQTANPMNLDGERAITGPRHVAKAFMIYDLPGFFDTKSWTGRMLNGWQVSGTMTLSGGNPLDVQLGEDWNYDSVGGDRPDLAGPITYTSGTTDQRAASYFDRSAFALPSTRNTFGNLRRNALWGPGRWFADASLLKSFAIREGMTAQFRAEAFNLFNHANLNDPNTNMRSADYTRIVNRSGNRTMQLGIRFLF